MHTLDPRVGGPVACVRQVGMEMIRRGHLVRVVSLSDPPNSAAAAEFPVTNIPLGPGLLGYCINPRIIGWLRKNAATFDVFVINGLWQFQGVVTSVVAWLCGKPYVVYIHGHLGPLGKRSLWSFMKKFVYWCLVEYWVVRQANFVIFTSQEEAIAARKFFPFYRWREAVVENGVERPPTSSTNSVVRLVARFPELKGKSIIMFLGRLNPGKGCDILLEAFASVLSRDARFHLMIVGPDEDPAYSARLRAQASELGIQDRVTWTGMLLGEDKEAAFALASLFVSPSHHENFGMSIVEALCRGVPVIATNKINIHSMLTSTNAAIVCDDTVQGVSHALREWMEMTKDARESLRARQLDAFERLFSVERTAERLDSVLAQALDPRRRNETGAT